LTNYTTARHTGRDNTTHVTQDVTANKDLSTVNLDIPRSFCINF